MEIIIIKIFNIKKLILIIGVIFSPFFFICQKDSLIQILDDPSQSDTTVLSAYKSLSYEYLFKNQDLDSALYVVSLGIKYAEVKNLKKWEGRLLHQRAYIKGEYKQNNKSAVLDLINALKIFEKLNDKNRAKDVYIELGISNYYLKNYHQSLNYLFKAEKLALSLKNKKDLALIYGNIGPVYEKINEDEIALDYYNKAEGLYFQLNDELNYSKSKLNRTNILIKTYSDSIKIRDDVIERYELLKQVFIKYKDDYSLMICLGNLGYQIGKTGNYKIAMDYLKKAEKLAIKYNELELLVDLYETISNTYDSKNDLSKALEYHKKYMAAYDSLYQANQTRVIAELQTKYDTEKKENENKLLRQESLLKDQDLINERYSKYALFGGLFLSLLIVVSVYGRLRSSRKKNNLIEKQKKDIEFQKQELEEVNKEVMDSINYAQRIQEAMLKAKKHVSDYLPTHFVLYKPKNVVSGDFYWFAEKKGYLFVAVGDCTGHGVPGAMLSMLGISFLNEIHSTEKLYNCAEILDILKVKIVEELSQEGKEGDMSDGMDISLIRMDLNTGNVNWAGANNSLFIMENGIITEINSDRQPIGYSDIVSPFTNHVIRGSKEAVYYLFSDGYIDQFGGKKGKKLKQKGFQKKLIELSNSGLEDQLVELESFFDHWRGDMDQLDDVTVLGLQSSMKLQYKLSKKVLMN